MNRTISRLPVAGFQLNEKDKQKHNHKITSLFIKKKKKTTTKNIELNIHKKRHFTLKNQPLGLNQTSIHWHW